MIKKDEIKLEKKNHIYSQIIKNRAHLTSISNKFLFLTLLYQYNFSMNEN